MIIRTATKKPVQIQCVQLTAENWEEVAAWCNGNPAFEEVGVERTFTSLSIPTLEGPMQAQIGRWIIRGVKGEFYPCKPDIFAATYVLDDEPAGG